MAPLKSVVTALAVTSALAAKDGPGNGISKSTYGEYAHALAWSPCEAHLLLHAMLPLLFLAVFS